MEESNASAMLAALAHPTRLRAFRAMIEAGPGGIAAGDLAGLTAAPASTLSSHLARLEHAGLVISRRASRNIFYAVEIDRVRALLGWLVEDCCGGRADLCGGLVVTAQLACID